MGGCGSTVTLGRPGADCRESVAEGDLLVGIGMNGCGVEASKVRLLDDDVAVISLVVDGASEVAEVTVSGISTLPVDTD